jgi:transposase
LDNIKSDIKDKLSKKEISEKYKVGLTTLKRFLKKNNLVYIESRGGKLDFLSEDDFISSFKELGSFTSVGKKYGVSDKALQKWCERNGLPWRKKELVEYIEKK